MRVKLGHFELLEQIGKGGMATVYLAYDPSLNRKVAIKLLDEELAKADPQFVENFIHEAQTAAGINHPNIVQIYFVGEENGSYYIAMELLAGKSLDEIMKEKGPQSEASVIKIGIEMAEALKAAYTNEMIHGDIKPQNIFITDSGTAKLLDFGLAKMANIEATQESDGSVWGSAYYISPERVGHKAEDFRSDIYSLGATLFHTLVGHPPFDADTPGELAQKRLSEKAPSLRSIDPNISVGTEQLIARMLSKSTFLRHLDYDSLLKDLRSIEPNPEVNIASASSKGKKQKSFIDTTALAAQIMANTANLSRQFKTKNSPSKQIKAHAVKKKSILPLFWACSSAVIILGAAAYFILPRDIEPEEGSAETTTSGNITATTMAADLVSVPFQYTSSTAKTVALVGSFNDWKPEAMVNIQGTWTLRKDLKYLESYEYQFIVNGKAGPDPKQPGNMTRSDRHGGEMTVFTVKNRVYPD